MGCVSMLNVEGLTKFYGETEAVRDLSFRVDAGRILGLVGPNGAGKTTTLRIVSGILPETRGRIEIGGQDLKSNPVGAKSLLAYVPDMPNPFDNLTVMEHLRFTAAVYGVPDVESRAARLLDEFELTPKRDALASELSRGMKQKLAISCAYLHDPKLILLDEPLTGLDPRGIRTMIDSIREQARRGAAVVVSSHLLELVEKVCETVLILHRGRKVLDGTLDEIRAAITELQKEASLEQIFFHATEEGQRA